MSPNRGLTLQWTGWRREPYRDSDAMLNSSGIILVSFLKNILSKYEE